jgi:archaellum component FlaG (FlaF/FlaG flagellin family)
MAGAAAAMASSKAVAGFLAKILASVVVMGVLTGVQQHLGNLVREVGKSVVSMVGILFNSFKNRNK